MSLQESKSYTSQEELLSQLLGLSRKMAEIRQLRLLLDFIFGHMMALVNAERGYVVVKRNDQLEFKMSRNTSGQEVKNRVDQVSHSILDHVFQHEQSILVKNALLDPRFSISASVIKFRIRSVMAVPLIANNSVIGAFYVENRTKSGIFSKRELEILEFFSHHAAIAIVNADVNDNLERLVQERTQQLEEAKNHAELVSKAKTDFLAFISHELRSPLSGILMHTELLELMPQSKLPQKQARAVQHIRGNTEHILSLVNDLLDLDMIEAGLLDINLKAVEIEPLFQRLVPTIESLLQDKPVTLTITYADALPSIKADEKRLYQILLNILANAAKFTQEGYINVTTSLFDNKHLLICIEDSGIGIKEDEHERIFQPYKQSKNTLTHTSGYGLGLPISKRLVNLLDGNIWFESTFGQGTKFFIKLPSTTK